MTSTQLFSGFFGWKQNRVFRIICFCRDLAKLYIVQIKKSKVLFLIRNADFSLLEKTGVLRFLLVELVSECEDFLC
jgi:hypothetical protein